MHSTELESRYLFRPILPEEAGQAAHIEQVCFPPNEACAPDKMYARIAAAPALFLVAVDRQTGLLAGFLNGLSTHEAKFRDEFFLDAGLYRPDGPHVMLLGLDVLPEHRRRGLASEIVRRYVAAEQKNGRRSLILTCLEEKVPMYLGMGFQDLGMADSAWGGEAWHEMVYWL